MGAIELGAAFAMGLMGSVHCVTMCGGLAGVLCAGPAGGPRVTAGTHAGRLATYAALGAAGGAVGRIAHATLPLGAVQLGARVLVAATLVGVGLYLMGALPWLTKLEALGARVVGPVRRAVSASASAGVGASMLRGLVWGLVPCGLVYGAVGLAMATQSIASGALTLAVFGAGTLPALLVVGGLAEGIRRFARHARIRAAAGLLVCLSGGVQLTMAALEVGAIEWPSVAGERPCCARRHALEAQEAGQGGPSAGQEGTAP
jgi:sulfite exporter TauE/SafE